MSTLEIELGRVQTRDSTVDDCTEYKTEYVFIFSAVLPDLSYEGAYREAAHCAKTWSAADVNEFLKSLGFPEEAKTFAEQVRHTVPNAFCIASAWWAGSAGRAVLGGLRSSAALRPPSDRSSEPSQPTRQTGFSKFDDSTADQTGWLD